MGLDSVAFVGFLLAVPWPFWRLAASTPVRHRRRDQILLLAVLGGYALLVVAVAVRWPALLPVVAALAAVGALAFWWRSMPGHGARRGIPPGRIGLHPLGLFDDVDHLSREAERYGPIFKIGATFPVPTLTPIICIVGHDLGLELLRDHERSLEVYPPFPTSRLIPRGFLRNMTVDDHERYAPVFRQAVTTSADAAFEAAVGASARRVLARMHADSAAAGDSGIAVGRYLRDFAFDVLARLHLGFESESEAQRQLAAQFRALAIEHISRWWSPQQTRRARWAATVRQLQREFGPDAPTPTIRPVLGDVLAAARSRDRTPEAALDEETIVGNVLQMQESGTQDLSALLAWVVKHLGDHPVWLDRVREEAAASGGGTRSLAERVIRESLRLEQSEYLFRRTTEDVRFRGFLFPKGWRVRICIREAHRAPDVFDRPTEFDPDRFLRPAYPLTEYAPFGLYRHRCLAARVVQTIGRIFVDELARGYRLTIVQDGPREHGRFHWQPSPRLRVRLEPHDR